MARNLADIARPRQILWLALAAYLVVSAYVGWRCIVLQPYSDMFDWVARYLDTERSGDWATYLFTPHNGHRIVWTLGVLALDANVFGARGWLFVAVGATCLITTAALLGREAARAAPAPIGLIAAAYAVMLTLMAGNLLDASVAINTSYVHALVFCVAALVLAEPQDGDTPRRVALRRAAALACFLAAILGNAIGFAIMPVLVFAAWQAGADRRWLATLIVGGGALAWAYLRGQAATAVVGAEPVTRHLGAAVELLLSYLGLPFTRAAPRLGWIFGLAVLILSLVGIILKGRAGASRAERVATQLIAFSLVTAAMAAVGRTTADAPWNVPLRYAVFLTPLHVGLVMLAAPHAARLRAAHRPAVDLALAAAALVLLGHQLVAGVLAIRTTDVNRVLIADFRRGLRTPRMQMTVHPNLDLAQDVSLRMREKGLYPDELHLPPQRNLARSPASRASPGA